jgi:hypothetical protein
MVYGFKTSNGVAYPLTGMVVLDSFYNAEYVKKDNRRTDSMFVEYLMTIDKNTLPEWLRKESLRRGVYKSD